MKRALGLAALLLLVGAIGYGWYFFYGPVQGLRIPERPSVAAQEANAAEPFPEPATVDPQRVPSQAIAVEPSAEEIENFPARITIRDGEQTFVAEYTGQFRRTKEVLTSLDIYDIASYIVEPTKGESLELLDGLLIDGKAKVYMIRFLSTLPGRPLMNDIYKDINTEFTDVDLERLRENVDNFCLQFKNGSRRGDVVYVVWLPGGTVYSGYNRAEPLTLLVHDIPFARALWRNWTGPRRGNARFNLVRRYVKNEAP